MSTYTPSPVRITPTTLPDDGQDVEAADVNVPFETALDGVLYATTHGADRLEPLADVTALAAILAPTDKMVRNVIGLGLYVFLAGAATTVDSPTVVAAADATPGRWFNAVYSLRNFSSGLAGLDATGAVMLNGSLVPKFGNLVSRPRAVSMHDYRVTELNVTRARTASFLPYYLNGAPAPAGGDMACINDGILTFKNAPGGANTQGVSICLDPYMHNGARLASVQAWLVGAAGHAGLTLTQASLGVFRKAALSAGTLQSLLIAGDFVTDAQASVPAYETAHGLTLTTDQNNVIDTSAFTYSVQFWNEFGTQSLPGLQLYGLKLTFDNITDMRFP